jgi:nicotinamidase-related amidase
MYKIYGGFMSSALLIIDMQNDFVLPSGAAPVPTAIEIVPGIVKALNYFRSKALPVFHIVREYRSDGSDIEITRLNGFLTDKKYGVPDTWGCQIIEDITPLDDEYRIVKNRFSGFMNTELDFILRRKGINKVVVCGIQYPNCIRATVYDAVAIGYEVFVLTDATTAATPEIAYANIVDMKNIGVSCDSFKNLSDKKIFE